MRPCALSPRLLAIDLKEFRVELTCRSADLQNFQNWEKAYCTDPYYKPKSEEDVMAEKAEKATAKKAQVREAMRQAGECSTMMIAFPQ